MSHCRCLRRSVIIVSIPFPPFALLRRIYGAFRPRQIFFWRDDLRVVPSVTAVTRRVPPFELRGPASSWVSQLLLLVENHLRSRSAQFELVTHLLDLRCLLFQTCGKNLHAFLLLRDELFLLCNSSLELSDGRFLRCSS